jgi:hypothetical protein
VRNAFSVPVTRRDGLKLLIDGESMREAADMKLKRLAMRRITSLLY